MYKLITGHRYGEALPGDKILVALAILIVLSYSAYAAYVYISVNKNKIRYHIVTKLTKATESLEDWTEEFVETHEEASWVDTKKFKESSVDERRKRFNGSSSARHRQNR